MNVLQQNISLGFSKQVIALLNSHKARYETFDILEDYEVREGNGSFLLIFLSISMCITECNMYF